MIDVEVGHHQVGHRGGIEAESTDPTDQRLETFIPCHAAIDDDQARSASTT